MAHGRKEIYKDGKATQFPHNDPTKGGRNKTRKLRELLEELGEKDNKIKLPLSKCEITATHVILTMPSREHIAMNLQTKAKGDVQWFKEWAKVMGEYAPEQHDVKQIGPDIDFSKLSDSALEEIENAIIRETGETG